MTHPSETSTSGFTHLHVHSEYSLLDGAAGVKKLIVRCKELGMDSIALTDHGNLFGAVTFYSQAKKAGIKPILGMEAYIAPGSRFEKDAKGIRDASHHLLLLAENNQGYHNLLKLASIGYQEGFYYRPRIDRDVLQQYHEGLICTSACMGGQIPTALAQGDLQQAQEIAEFYLHLFGPERFFIEIQWHCPDQNAVTPMLVDLADKIGASIVATNDVHFLRQDDYRAHEVLTCISTGKTLDEENRMKYPPQLYLKSAQEMRETFARWPQACDNTQIIAQRCDLDLDFSTQHAPVFQPPEGKTPDDYLQQLCEQGLEKRYARITKPIRERLERELEVIRGKNFSSYFLIVWDFVQYARQNNIPANPRGSGVGTLVGYALGISNVDPLKYGLLFERFMDPERNEMPDIDIDICQQGRADVINYVRKRYGHVAQIITFGTMKARAVIRDVCRVLNVPLPEADKLAKLVPETLGITLEQAIEQEPKLLEWAQRDPKIQDVLDIGKRLEGLARHASVHAAGVVIADQPLTDFLPLYKAPDSDDLITQFDGPTVEKVGLLKMDFLGLKTLSVLERARELVKLGKDIDVDIQNIDLSDKKVLKLFAQGQTKGVFQFESTGMRDLLQNMKPDRIEDLIAANALYRPGPMTLIPDYNSRKHGQPWTVPHPIMKKVLKETYGIMVYQEQIMQILNGLGNLPLARAYRLIKAIGKKNHKIIQSESDAFIKGCLANGIDQQKAEELFEMIQRFAGYGFNKSHSTQYAILAFQTGYFKHYYPTEFMAALLTFDMDSTDKIAEYIEECKQIDIPVLPPDINESFADFTVIYNNPQHKNTQKSPEKKQAQESIRFGLAAVKGVGARAVQELIRVRLETGRFESIFHLCQHIDMRMVNRAALEALIKAGAMDSLGGSRAQFAAALEEAMAIGNKAQQDQRQGQLSFFDTFEQDEQIRREAEKLPDVKPWPQPLLLQYEKDVLGLYVTDHPLSQFAETIYKYSTVHSDTLRQAPANTEVILGGIVSRIRYCVTKNGRGAGSRMAMFTLEDLNGSVEAVIFPDALAQYESLMQKDQMIFVRGMVDFRREDPSIRVNQVYDMNRADEQLTEKVSLELNPDHCRPEKLEKIKQLCLHHKGHCPVFLEIPAGNHLHVTLQINMNIRPDDAFCRQMEALLGEGNVHLHGPANRLKAG